MSDLDVLRKIAALGPDMLVSLLDPSDLPAARRLKRKGMVSTVGVNRATIFLTEQGREAISK